MHWNLGCCGIPSFEWSQPVKLHHEAAMPNKPKQATESHCLQISLVNAMSQSNAVPQDVASLSHQAVTPRPLHFKWAKGFTIHKCRAEDTVLVQCHMKIHKCSDGNLQLDMMPFTIPKVQPTALRSPYFTCHFDIQDVDIPDCTDNLLLEVDLGILDAWPRRPNAFVCLELLFQGIDLII